MKNTVAPERARAPGALRAQETRWRPNGRAPEALPDSEKHGGARAGGRPKRSRLVKNTVAPERADTPDAYRVRGTWWRPSGRAPEALSCREKHGVCKGSCFPWAPRRPLPALKEGNNLNLI